MPKKSTRISKVPRVEIHENEIIQVDTEIMETESRIKHPDVHILTQSSMNMIPLDGKDHDGIDSITKMGQKGGKKHIQTKLEPISSNDVVLKEENENAVVSTCVFASSETCVGMWMGNGKLLATFAFLGVQVLDCTSKSLLHNFLLNPQDKMSMRAVGLENGGDDLFVAVRNQNELCSWHSVADLQNANDVKEYKLTEDVQNLFAVANTSVLIVCKSGNLFLINAASLENIASAKCNFVVSSHFSNGILILLHESNWISLFKISSLECNLLGNYHVSIGNAPSLEILTEKNPEKKKKSGPPEAFAVHFANGKLLLLIAWAYCFRVYSSSDNFSSFKLVMKNDVSLSAAAFLSSDLLCTLVKTKEQILVSRWSIPYKRSLSDDGILKLNGSSLLDQNPQVLSASLKNVFFSYGSNVYRTDFSKSFDSVSSMIGVKLSNEHAVVAPLKAEQFLEKLRLNQVIVGNVKNWKISEGCHHIALQESLRRFDEAIAEKNEGKFIRAFMFSLNYQKKNLIWFKNFAFIVLKKSFEINSQILLNHCLPSLLENHHLNGKIFSTLIPALIQSRNILFLIDAVQLIHGISEVDICTLLDFVLSQPIEGDCEKLLAAIITVSRNDAFVLQALIALPHQKVLSFLKVLSGWLHTVDDANALWIPNLNSIIDWITFILDSQFSFFIDNSGIENLEELIRSLKHELSLKLAYCTRMEMLQNVLGESLSSSKSNTKQVTQPSVYTIETLHVPFCL